MAPQRLAPWPQVPTMAELKLPDIRYFSNFALFAPAGTPPEIMKPMLDEIGKALASPQYQQMLDKTFMQPGTGIGQEFVEQVRADYANNQDRKSVGTGRSVSVRVDLGGGRSIKKKNKEKTK